ncbi:MAG: fasciclin domain-containing protein [Prolixibacteraceae bacterium]|nr:fasciclin domain-containing protein [Prolixibacteraceae bacterium]
MQKFTVVFIILLCGAYLFSCKDPIEKNPEYERPVWLQGKVYDVAKSVPELSVFARCIEKTGLNNLINTSGLYTVMAPTNKAFEAYFSEHPQYASIDDIDSLELKRLVEFHILLMPFTKTQLRLLNTSGWINEDTKDPEYSGYKRETLYRPDNMKLKVTEREGKQPVIDVNGNAERIVYSATNKYAPLFFQEYMNYSRINSADYSYYFNRSFESKEIFFAGAKLLKTSVDNNNDGELDDSYPAENGYVYLIDKVIEPVKNVYEYLWNNSSTSGKQYTGFGSLVNDFAQFSINNEATLSQEGANEGLEVDQLNNLTYPTLAFNLFDEATHTTARNSIAYHHAIFAPTNEAYFSFISNVIRGEGRYSSITDVPYMIKRMLVNNHMAKQTPYYPSLGGLNGSFTTKYGSKLDLKGTKEIEIKYGSNATFVGIDKLILPREFLSVVAPVILSKEYSSFMWSLYFTGAFQILNNASMKYTFFPIPNAQFEKDSTLFITAIDHQYQDPYLQSARVYNNKEDAMINLSVKSGRGTSLRNLVYGQAALGVPVRNCRKEFLKNLNNYYIVINNETSLVTGGMASAIGFNGDLPIYQYMDKKLVENLGNDYGQAPDNGETYAVDNWFRYPESIFSSTSVTIDNNSVFVDLLKATGLIDPYGRFTFLKEGELMTVFVPSDEALHAIHAETFAKDDLKKLLLSHFVSGTIIFTDNVNKNSSATNYYTKSGKQISIRTSTPDEIEILKPDQSTYVTVVENGSDTNRMYLGWDNGNDSDGNTIEGKALAGIAVVVHKIAVAIQPDIVFDK